MRGVAVPAAAVLLLSGCAHFGTQACASSSADRAAVERAVRSFFDGLRRDDPGSVRRVTSTSFRAFDAGKRFDIAGLTSVVQDAHRKGVALNWNLGEMDMRFGCDAAWVSWENSGSAGIPPNVVPVHWLESAVLVKERTAWKIDFFHSTRAAPAAAQQ